MSVQQLSRHDLCHLPRVSQAHQETSHSGSRVNEPLTASRWSSFSKTDVTFPRCSTCDAEFGKRYLAVRPDKGDSITWGDRQTRQRTLSVASCWLRWCLELVLLHRVCRFAKWRCAMESCSLTSDQGGRESNLL